MLTIILRFFEIKVKKREKVENLSQLENLSIDYLRFTIYGSAFSLSHRDAPSVVNTRTPSQGDFFRIFYTFCVRVRIIYNIFICRM